MPISDIHDDILKTHILTKLDPQTLASAGCTSSRLHSLCSDHHLWSEICQATWPSTADPLITSSVSSFSSGHRSFFSDAFSSPTRHLTTGAWIPTSDVKHLISAVDLRYSGDLIFSKVEVINTVPSDWFQTTPFRVDLLEPKEIVLTGVKLARDDHVLLSDLENKMTMSWIVIDPTRNRAVNLSSVKPVSVQRNWLTDGIALTFALVVVKDGEYVTCNVQVTCGVNEGRGELTLTVSGVSLTVLDVYGKCLSGRDSMVILQGLAAGERRRRGGEGEERERYEEYIRMRRERNEKTERSERRLDMACVASGVAMFVAFWSFVMC